MIAAPERPAGSRACELAPSHVAGFPDADHPPRPARQSARDRAVRPRMPAQLPLLPEITGAPAPLAPPAPPTPEELVALARGFVGQARAPRTLRAYDGDWRRFMAWCDAHGHAPYPAEPTTVALYLTELAHTGKKLATLRRARASIAVAHRARGTIDECPTRHALVLEMRGFARAKTEPPERAPALAPDQLSAMLATLGRGRRGLRDRALLTLRFAGAFRRSALIVLHVEDLRFVRAGLEVLVRGDKSDPTREGRVLPVAFAAAPERCAVRAVRAWIDAAELREGPLFRAVGKGGTLRPRALPDRAVDRLVKRAARAAKVALPVSAHSLRAGFITSTVRQKHPLERIRVVSGHKEGSRAFEAYILFAGLWDGYAGEGVL